MAYIPGFEYDIFISYAHVDNLSVQEGEEGWISQFQKHLEIAIAKRIGRMGVVSIWRDKRLQGDQLFDRTIREALEKSALFLAITSNGYLASDYCQQELDMFVEKAGEETYRVSIADRSRVLLALINNIPDNKWPKAFEGISGYHLYDAEDATDLGTPSDFREKLFRNQLKNLTDSLCYNLRAFKKFADQVASDVVPGPPSEKAPEDSSPTVFLADVSGSLRSIRNRLADKLEREEIKVITNIPPPYGSRPHVKRVKHALQTTTLSVNLLDHISGREIEGEPDKTYAQKQVELVRDAGLHQIIWVPRDLDLSTIEEETHKAFLHQLENGPRRDARYDFVRSTKADLLPQILEKLTQLQTAQTVNSATPSAVLLDSHIKDLAPAAELSNYLVENQITAYLNPQEDDPNKNMDILEDRLGRVNTLMILFGNVSADWVRQRLGAALQLTVIRMLSIKAFCIVAVPPEKKSQELDFHVGQIPITTIDNSRGGLDPSLLTPVLEGLQGGAA
jgi:hypothetical protein